MKALFGFVFIYLITSSTFAIEYHVAFTGNNDNDGSALKPFRTISTAALRAKAGDIIAVHAGTYRENVSPAFGGTSDINRITHQAAPGEKVFIKGSEVITNWTKVKNDVWKVTDVMNRYTPNHYPHSTQLAGTSTITGGDDRFYNNIFAIQQGGNSQTDNAEAFGSGSDRGESYGLNAYDVYSPSIQAYLDTLKKAGNVYVVTFAKVEQPVYIASNLYFGVGKPCIHEKNSIKDENFKPEVRIEEKGDEVFLHINVNDSYSKVKTQLVNTSMLGMPRICEEAFENPDGTPITVDQDYLGKKRSEISPFVGPFEGLKQGEQVIKVW